MIKSYIRYILFSLILLLMLFTTSLTSFAIGDGGIANDTALNGGGGSGYSNPHYGYLGLKVTLQKRSDVLSVGSVNSNAYDNGLKGRQGIVLFFDNKGNVTTAPNPCNEIIFTGTGITSDSTASKAHFSNVLNVKVTSGEFSNLLGLAESELKTAIKKTADLSNCYGNGGDGYWSHLANYLTEKLFAENGMLYDMNKRMTFYNSFSKAMSNAGRSCGISAEDFMSKQGVVVIEPIVGIHSSSCTGYSSYMTFRTADDIGTKYGKFYSFMTSVHKLKFMYNQSCNGVTVGGVRVKGMYGKSNTQRGMSFAGTITNIYDVNGNKFTSTAPSAEALSDSPLNNWRQGFLVFGMSWKGLPPDFELYYDKGSGIWKVEETNSKAATNIAVKAVQNSDGSFTMQSVASLVSQKDGSMPYDGNLSSVPSSVDGLVGGQVYNNAPMQTRLSNIFDYWESGASLYGYGAYTITGGKTISSSDTIEAFRKTLLGNNGSYSHTVSSGDYNAGTRYTPKYKYANAKDLASAFASYACSSKIASELTTVTNPGNLTPSKVGYNLTAWANNSSETGKADVTANTWAETAGAGTVKLESDHTFGVAVEYLVDYKEISSYISYAKLTFNNSLNPTLTVGSNGKSDYTLGSEGHFYVSPSRYYIAIVPNSSANDSYQLSDNNRNGNTFWNKVRDSVGNGSGYGVSSFKNVVNSYLTTNNITSSSTKANALVSLGGSGGEGYSVFVLEISIPSTIYENASLNLEDYQLNFITQNLLGHTGGVLTGSGESIMNTTSWARHYGYTISHSVANTPETRASRPSNLILYNTALGNSYTYSSIKSGVSDIQTTHAKNYNYAYNLSRAHYGDARSISALSAYKIDDTTKDVVMNTLGNTYGIVPNDSNGSPIATAYRNSWATIKNGSIGTIAWKGSWGLSYSNDLAKTYSASNTGTGNTYVVTSSNRWVTSSARPLSWKGVSINELSVSISARINKYSTNTLDTGSNTKNNTTINTSNNGETYRLARVKSADYVLSYYPEVAMRAYITTGTSISGNGSVTPRTIITMAERVRKTKPSSLYLLKVDQDDGGVDGDIFSNTMGTGDIGNVNNSLPVVYGGSDVTVNIDSTNISLKMYGYALDLINYDKDRGGMNYGSGTTSYQSVINDASATYRDPYSTWGNDSTNSTSKTKDNFNAWVSEVISSLGIKMSLDIKDGTTVKKEYTDFSVTMPEFNPETYYAEDNSNVYTISIKRGAIEETTEFIAMINQIASDYGCSYADAKALFENSDIYQSILRSIEDTKDSFNTAQNVNTTENGAHAVRTDNQNDNWYDEEVKTFVIRRYVADAVTFEDVVLSDKIDYDAAPSSQAGGDNHKDTVESKKQYTGEWYFEIFSDNDIYGDMDSLARLHVNGADFAIPTATTSDNLW